MLLGYYMEEMKKLLKSGDMKTLWRQYCNENNLEPMDKIMGEHKKNFAKYVTNILDVRAKESYTRDNHKESEERQ